MNSLITYKVTDKSTTDKFEINARPLPFYICAIIVGALLLAGGAWVVYSLLGGSVEISVAGERVTYTRSSMSGKISKSFSATSAEINEVKIEVIKTPLSRSNEVVIKTADGDFVTGL